MESSSCMGLMAVVAVSSSVAIMALHAHRRLVSDFMKKVELELLGASEGGGGGGGGIKRKKKVRFAADVAEPSSNNKEYRMRRSWQPA